jgi:hypothetical protein
MARPGAHLGTRDCAIEVIFAESATSAINSGNCPASGPDVPDEMGIAFRKQGFMARFCRLLMLN